MPLVPGDGEHGVRIVAQDLEILRNDGVFIREHAGHLPLLLLGHGRKLRDHGKVRDGVQVLPVLYLVVEQGQPQEAEDADDGAPAAAVSTDFLVLGEMG